MTIGRTQMNRQLYNMGSGEEMMQENVQEGIMQVAPEGAQQAQAEQYRPVAEDLAQDPKKALALLIKMLIEQGVPPEQAEKIAMEMIQGVAEGGMEEVSEDTRVEARFGGRMEYASGGIGRLVDREQYGLGSFFKKVTSIPRKLAKGVKSVAKSPLGRMALTVAAGYYLGPAGLNIGSGMGAIGGGALRAALGNLAVQAVSGQKINFKEALAAGAIGGVVGGVQQANTLNTGVTDSSGQFGGQENLTINEDTYGGGYSQPDLDYANSVTSAPAELNYANSITSAPTTANVVKNVPTSNFASIKDYVGDAYNTGMNLVKENPKTAIAAGGILAASMGGEQPPEQNPGESMEDYNRRVEVWKTTLNKNLGNTPGGNYGLYASANNPLYPVRAANGGRIGYQQGGISELTQQSFYEPMAMMAQGGRMGYAYGNSVEQGIMSAPQIADQMGMPVGNPRQNQQGIAELDYREEGGFVPPIGIKEKEDDIPAMLSNNEFVFTADAVRNAGGGDPNVGAQKMYSMMKQLENGGRA